MDIAVTDVREMPERFHAQLNAKEKTYTYRMTVSEVPSVFERKYTYHCFKTPDVNAMQQAAQELVGKHDFKNFSTAKKSKSKTLKGYKKKNIFQKILYAYLLDLMEQGKQVSWRLLDSL